MMLSKKRSLSAGVAPSMVPVVQHVAAVVEETKPLRRRCSASAAAALPELQRRRRNEASPQALLPQGADARGAAYLSRRNEASPQALLRCGALRRSGRALEVEETKPLRRRCSVEHAGLGAGARELVEETKPLRRRCSGSSLTVHIPIKNCRRNEASPQALLQAHEKLASNWENMSKKRSLSAGVAPRLMPSAIPSTTTSRRRNEASPQALLPGKRAESTTCMALSKKRSLSAGVAPRLMPSAIPSTTTSRRRNEASPQALLPGKRAESTTCMALSKKRSLSAGVAPHHLSHQQFQTLERRFASGSFSLQSRNSVT